MNPYAVLSLASAIVAIFFGVNVLLLDSRSKLNRTFLFLMLLMGLKAFMEFGYRSAEGETQAEFWWTVDLFWPFLSPMVLYFALLFTKRSDIIANRFFIFILFFPSILVLLLEVSTDYITGPPEKMSWGWEYTVGESPELYLLLMIWTMTLMLTALVVIAKRAYKIRYRNVVVPSVLIFIGLLLPILSSLSTEFLLPLMEVNAPVITSSVFIVSSIFLWMGMRYQNLFNINKREAAEVVIETLSDAVLLTDLNGNIIYQNRGAYKLLGYSRSQMADMNLRDLFPEGDGVGQMVGNRLKEKKLEEEPIFDVETRFKPFSGIPNPVLLTIFPYKDRRGRKRGCIVIGKDITFRKMFEDELSIRKTHLEERVKERTREIEEANIKLRKIIKALKREKEMSTREKEKARFYLDLMVHDIANQHQGIDSWISMAEMFKNDPDRLDNAITRAKESIQRSIRLVKNVILLSEIRSSKPDLKVIEVLPFLKNAVEEIKKSFPEKNVNINIDAPVRILRVVADQHLQEAFYQIVHNAVKFSKGVEVDVYIRLRVTNSGSVLRMEFCDEGTGIPDEKKSMVFERMESSEDLMHTGIGLSIVRVLVKRYKGTVHAEDRVKGKPSEGLCLVMRLPLWHD